MWNDREITNFRRFLFNRSMQGRDSYRLDLATSIQEQYAVYRILPVLKIDTNATLLFRFLKRWLACLTFFCT